MEERPFITPELLGIVLLIALIYVMSLLPVGWRWGVGLSVAFLIWRQSVINDH